MEDADRPHERAGWLDEESRSRPRRWLAPFAERQPYSGITYGTESRLGDEFGPRLLVILAVLLYAYLLGRFTLDRYDAFEQTGFDLGIFDQGVWLLSRFRAPFVSIMGLDLFGDHASYILFAIVPLYWLWPAAQVLLIAQTLALAVAAIPVFLLAKQALRNPWLAVLPAVAFLLNPALAWMNIENFHPDSFEVPLVLFALYFMTQRRWRPYVVMIVLLLSVKEDVALLVVPLGVYVGLRYDRRMGFITADLAIIWSIATLFFIGPLLSGVGAGSLDAFRVPFGGWKGLISTALTRPWEVAGYMLTAVKVKYLIQLLVPVFFLPLLSAGTLIVLPPIIFNLLSTFSYQTNIRYHYTSLIIPVFAWAALLYLQRIKDDVARGVLVVAILLGALFSAYVWGPADWSRAPAHYYDPADPQARAVAEAIELIPPEAGVAARSRFTTHLTHREHVYEFPTPFYVTSYGDNSARGQRLPVAEEVDYVLDIPAGLSEAGAKVFAELQQQEGFRQIFSKEGVVLLERTAGASP